MSRVMDTVTRNLIADLCQLLKKHPTAALRTLEVSAPVLVEQLQQVMIWAVDRRDVGAEIDQQLHLWLKQFPQAKDAARSLLAIPESVCPMFPANTAL